MRHALILLALSVLLLSNFPKTIVFLHDILFKPDPNFSFYLLRLFNNLTFTTHTFTRSLNLKLFNFCNDKMHLPISLHPHNIG